VTFRKKILLSSVLPVAIIMLAVTLIVIDQMRSRMLEAARDQIQIELTTAAQVIEHGNQETIAIARGLATAQRAGFYGRRQESLEVARQVLEDNLHLIGSYIAYEPNADGGDRAWLRQVTENHGSTSSSGRFIPYWFRAPNAGGTITLEPLVEMETSLYYQGIKDKYRDGGRESYIITEPYRYNNQNLIIEQTVPLVIDGQFAGIAGVGRGLDFLDAFLVELKPFDSARLSLVSGRGRIIATTMDDSFDFDIRTMSAGDIYVTAEGTVPSELYKLDDGAYVLDPETATEARLARLSSSVRDRALRFIKDADSSVVQSFRAENTGRQMLGGAARIPTGNWTLVLTVERDEIMRMYRGTLISVSAIAFIGFLSSVTIIILLVSRISERIRDASHVARRIADGDLTADVAVETGDESGRLQQAVRDMIGSLNTLIGKIRGTTIQLSSIATELFVGAREQEGVVAEFGSSTNEISAAAIQISATSEELAQTMADVNARASDTAVLAGGGEESLRSTAGAVERLQATAGSISRRLNEIQEKTNGIGIAVTTINKVADRTNMLSLNAAIEAEKAGEERAGFAIVAREVRRLADQTAAATLDIGQIVRELQGAAVNGVQEMGSFTVEVTTAAADIQRIGGQLEGIIERVQTLTGEFGRVNEGMQLQSAGASQIREALEGLVLGVQQTEQTLRDFRHASEHLQGAVADLRGEVARFRTNADEEATA
jgi:methyl-accepting chemotaxis protein WspA